MKSVVWEGNSREVLRDFPESVRRDLGTGIASPPLSLKHRYAFNRERN
jgi:hypothetical protein